MIANALRERIEALERDVLAPYAAKAADSKGRVVHEPEHEYRTAYQRDRDRILHSKSFRRLKDKTQVFLAPEGDHYRTRLTHTLEVAQIARTAARALMLNEDLVEAICLGHDLGHTPFGHAGETVLNEMLAGGFRHYEQSLRVVDILETRNGKTGLNLTFEVRDGILNHSKGKTILAGRAARNAATIEGDLVSICDAIAYINHDVDDAVRGRLITLDDLPREVLRELGATSSARINRMVGAIIDASGEDCIDMTESVRAATVELRGYLYRNVYPCEAIDREVRKAKKIVRELYQHLLEHPEEIRGRGVDDAPDRHAADMIAGMTDKYALQLYERLFFPTAWPA